MEGDGLHGVFVRSCLHLMSLRHLWIITQIDAPALLATATDHESIDLNSEIAPTSGRTGHKCAVRSITPPGFDQCRLIVDRQGRLVTVSNQNAWQLTPGPGAATGNSWPNHMPPSVSQPDQCMIGGGILPAAADVT